MTFNKVIVWGHKLGDPRLSNTFSFIHDSWNKTFSYLGYETLWLDNNDDISNINFDNCLFLTEGQVEQNMPVNNTSKYVLHNCNLDKYNSIISNCLNLQVYTKDCLTRNVQKMDEPLTCYQPEPDNETLQHGCNNRTIYQTWATNLLPHEIDAVDLIKKTHNVTKHNKLYWVGSICDGEQGNITELQELTLACTKRNISFVHAKLPNDKQSQAIQLSKISPAIQGHWQVDKHYVPCRVFKNISFGRMPLTNNKIVSEIFDDKIIYDSNIENLIEEGIKFESSADYSEIMTNLINEVKNKHTYINRIDSILKVL